MASTPHISAGDAAGLPGDDYAMAVGSATAGTIVVQTTTGTIAGATGSGDNLLANVSLSAEEPLNDGKACTLTQIIATGLGAALATTVVNTPQGFHVLPTVAPAPNTLYAFTYARA